MQNITIRKATKSDIENLIKLRIDFITDNKTHSLTLEEENQTIEQLREYYPKHLDYGDFIAVLAEIDGKIIATAFLIIFEKPVNPRTFITGKTALIINVLTYPEYRRQGIAMKLLELLIAEAKTANASYIELTATSMGKPVYEKLGFKENLRGEHTEMKLNLF
ncbi:MAG: GNAT family N-acetyltransferase [Oscillospiraceae bacterium]|nr:GNAT family N-acetyltransferase [Oscillospiraceae bacterium]